MQRMLFGSKNLNALAKNEVKKKKWKILMTSEVTKAYNTMWLSNKLTLEFINDTYN